MIASMSEVGKKVMVPYLVFQTLKQPIKVFTFMFRPHKMAFCTL